MVDNRADIVLALIGQCAGSRENLHQTDETEEQEDHPDGLVTLKDIAYFLCHLLILYSLFSTLVIKLSFACGNL
jgi:hypothetical protein